jgi:hypothetical protein
MVSQNREARESFSVKLWPERTSEWLYLLRSAKLCAVHNAQSGPLTGAKNLCAVAALPAALHTTSQKHLFWLSAIN